MVPRPASPASARVFACTLLLLPCASLSALSDRTSLATEAALMATGAALILRRPSPRLPRWPDTLLSGLATGLVAAALFVAQDFLMARRDAHPMWGAAFIAAYGVWGIVKPGLLVMLARESWTVASADAPRACRIAGVYWLAFAWPVSHMVSWSSRFDPGVWTFPLRDTIRIAVLAAASVGLLLCGLIAPWRASGWRLRRRR
jgi:hypothetical protein